MLEQVTRARPYLTLSALAGWPLPVWMILITLGIGLAGGFGANEVVQIFNLGFGRALGEFILILVPSFILAAAMETQRAQVPGSIAVAAAPLAGSGMICPDTAYAALSPIAGARRLELAFGAYAGFKLLYPAGPLIVATGLGVASDSLILYGFALLIPVWFVGAIWGRLQGEVAGTSDHVAPSISFRAFAVAFGPFALLAVLLVAGAVFRFPGSTVLEFLTTPKGALLLAAAAALISVNSASRRNCVETAVRRTASLLLLIGLASALGAMLTSVVPLASVIPTESGLLGIVGLFTLAALFKLAQGSSMATFAAVAPVAAPIVASMGVPPVAAVFAICAGSFVAILPNDSFYWLVRRDALPRVGDARALFVLAGGATLQAAAALAAIILAVILGFV